MSRIIAGSAGGRRLRTPPGTMTRPTSDRVREALFAALDAAVGSWDGLAVLDLFAGSGAVGLEALSRGADTAVLVARARRAVSVAERNARDLGLAGAEVVCARAESYLAGTPRYPFDVVYCDPPYAYGAGSVRDLLRRLADGGWLADRSTVVVERSRRDEPVTWPAPIEQGRHRTYGETVLWYGHFHA